MKPASLLLAGLLLGQSYLAAQSAPRLLPFQGHLTDPAGKPVPDGAKTILFQIFSAPVDGAILWAGEVHRTTVNGGLVNVQLGARNPLPRTRADDPERPFFDANLYLAITVDNNGDGRIDAGDPPLLPRQSIVSPVFAQESGNAGKLSGQGWSDLLEPGDAKTGKLKGDRIRTNSLATEHLKDRSVSAAKLQVDSVDTDNLKDGAVSGSKLQAGAVRESALADGSVTRPKIQGALLSELTKKFTGRPESIVRLSDGQTFAIPTNKWALVKAHFAVSYIAVGNPGGPRTADSDSTSYDAYALAGSIISIRAQSSQLLAGRENVLASLQDPLAYLVIDGVVCAHLRMPIACDLRNEFFGPAKFEAIWGSGPYVATQASAYASVYLYPDE